ncbi:MAG: C2H2-type zinc finger protein [Nitrososphaera sp.]
MKAKYPLYYEPDSREGHNKGTWKCDKCKKVFPSYRGLRTHKREVHCY